MLDTETIVVNLHAYNNFELHHFLTDFHFLGHVLFYSCHIYAKISILKKNAEVTKILTKLEISKYFPRFH